MKVTYKYTNQISKESSFTLQSWVRFKFHCECRINRSQTKQQITMLIIYLKIVPNEQPFHFCSMLRWVVRKRFCGIKAVLHFLNDIIWNMADTCAHVELLSLNNLSLIASSRITHKTQQFLDVANQPRQGSWPFLSSKCFLQKTGHILLTSQELLPQKPQKTKQERRYWIMK